MDIASILALIAAALEFPKEVLAIVNLLRATPEEKRSEIMKKVQDEYAKFLATGRPS